MNVVLLSLLVDPCDEEDPALHGPLGARLVSSTGSDVRVADAVISVLVSIATTIIVETATFTASCSLFNLQGKSMLRFRKILTIFLATVLLRSRCLKYREIEKSQVCWHV